MVARREERCQARQSAQSRLIPAGSRRAGNGPIRSAGGPLTWRRGDCRRASCRTVAALWRFEPAASFWRLWRGPSPPACSWPTLLFGRLARARSAGRPDFRLAIQGECADLSQLASRAVGLALDARVIGQVFDQVQELGAAVLGHRSLEYRPQRGNLRLRDSQPLAAPAVRACRPGSRGRRVRAG